MAEKKADLLEEIEKMEYQLNELRVRAKITSQNWRSDLVQAWSIQESKTTGIASYFEDFKNEASAKDELKQR